MNENQTLLVDLTATDVDGDGIALSAPVLPPNATLTDLGGGLGALRFAPNFTQAGPFTITVNATDNGVPSSLGSIDVIITVNNVNRAPLVNAPARISVGVGESLSLDFAASDPDGDLVVFSASNLPGSATITDNGDSTATLDYVPVAADAGSHLVAVSASDGNGGVSAVNTEVVVAAPPVDTSGCVVSGKGAPLFLAALFGLLGLLLWRRRAPR